MVHLKDKMTDLIFQQLPSQNSKYDDTSKLLNMVLIITIFLGNPPFHAHEKLALISSCWKNWVIGRPRLTHHVFTMAYASSRATVSKLNFIFLAYSNTFISMY